MKVLHVIPSVAERSGGPATAIVPMCCALRQQGVEVLLITTTAGMDETTKPSEYRGVPARFFSSQLGESFKYSRPLASWLSSNIQDFGLVHIHAVFNHSSVAAARACRKAGIPYVVRPLGTLDPWSMRQKSLRKRLFWQMSGKRMMQDAAAVHYTTEAEKLATEELLGLSHGRVITLGIEANSGGFDNLVYHFPELAGARYVLVLSRLHPKKGLHVLIDAFLSEAFADWRLVIAGDGPDEYVSQLKNKALAFGGKIVFTGWVDGEKKAALLDGASLLALPSHQENFGLCVMEALSHSVPVLVSPHVNLASEITGANAGWIADVDKNALAATLAEALADETERASRGRAGRELSLKYTWESTAKNLATLYQEILTQNGGADIHRI